MAIFHTISLLVVSISSIYALSCIPCDQTLCVKPVNCKGGLVKGVCGCCDVCAKTQGERCGGPWRIHGHCAKGLTCLSRTRMKNESGFLPKHFQSGICGPDVCAKKMCGFKERCKINKSGRPMCICPRRCSSKSRQPVCGLLNGKEYRNKCKLNREECFTKKEIGRIPGLCIKCTYQGQKYQFGETRPGAESCEICICRHGLWKCKIKLNCSTNSIPKPSKGRRCLMSTNTIYVACPPSYSCRIPPSDDNRNVRMGICKKVVYKPKKVPMLLEIHHNLNMASVSKQGDETKKITPSMAPTSEKLENSEAVRMSPVNEINHYVMQTVKPTTRELNKKKLKGGLIRHVCMADADVGTCNPASLNRWYYNASSKSCEQFQYSGCGGNFNNFLSKEKCQDVCHSELHDRQPWNALLTTQSSVLYRVPELTEKPSRDMLLEMCHDIKTGMSYRNGEKWNIDECISCTCINGRDLCIAASCHAACSKPIHVKGRCCPICESDLRHTENFVGAKETECRDSITGVSYHSGESWNRNDCVHCICFEGETSCMTSVCAKPTCEQPIKKNGVCCPVCSEDEQVSKPTKEIKPRCVDSDSGQSYTPGEAWKVNDCISCFCDPSGLSTCNKLSCPKSKCTNPVHLQGRCCPVCPESFLSACNYDNRLYLRGDFMLLIDRCTLCKCKGTTWNCTKKHCNKTVNGIDSTFTVKNNKISNDEHERNPSSDISGKLDKKEYFDSDNDEFIVEDPIRMIGRGTIVDHKENTTKLNNEKQSILNVEESATPSPSSHTGYQVETSTDTNENVDKTYVKKSHLGSTKRPGNNHGIQPLFIDYKNRRWSSSWYQDALHVSDTKNDTIVYRTKRLL